jgi:hypothetical protein
MRTKLRSKISLLFVVCAVLLAIPAVALADNIVDDLEGAATTKTITAGDSFANNYWVVANSAAGSPSGCDVGVADDGNTATFSINTPAGVTASPSSLTFDECKDGPNNHAQAVTFTSSTAGTYEITVSKDSGTGSYNTNPSKFTLVVNASSGGGGGGGDTTAPVITKVVTPASPDGNNGWYKSPVSVDWTVSDPESAISSQNGCDDFTINSDQLEQTYTCTATSAGGTSSDSVTLKVDVTKPTNVQFTGGGLSDGASYDFGDVPAAPTGCTADDATSGLAGPCDVTGYSTAVGNQTLTATATDNAGNVATATRSYTVKAWRLSGFYQPVDMDTATTEAVNTVKGGSTVPLKFEVFKASGPEFTDTAVVDTFTVKGVTCPATGFITDDIELTTTGGTSLRYDATAGQFIQNWQTTKKPGACYDVTMQTDDGSKLLAHFQLK